MQRRVKRRNLFFACHTIPQRNCIRRPMNLSFVLQRRMVQCCACSTSTASVPLSDKHLAYLSWSNDCPRLFDRAFFLTGSKSSREQPEQNNDAHQDFINRVLDMEQLSIPISRDELTSSGNDRQRRHRCNQTRHRSVEGLNHVQSGMSHCIHCLDENPASNDSSLSKPLSTIAGKDSDKRRWLQCRYATFRTNSPNFCPGTLI